MTNTMTYKGYSARIEYDDEDGIFTGRIAGIRDGVGFHADTVADLREAFHDAVEDYLEAWSVDRRRHTIRCASFVQRDPIFRDLFRKLAAAA